MLSLLELTKVKTVVASGKCLTDVGHDNEISSSVPRIIRLDSLGRLMEPW